MRKLVGFFFLFMLLGITGAFAQNKVEMADTFVKEGKIYVVIGCALIIFAGIVAHLVYLDRKVSRLEKENKQ